MSGWRQFAGGLGIALVAVVLIGASLVNAIAENRVLIDLPATETNTPEPSAIVPTSTPAATATPRPATSGANSTSQPSPTATIPAPPTRCPPPPGWVPYTIEDGDTLADLAARRGTTTQILAGGNCLATGTLLPGTVLYVPPLPPTVTPYSTPSRTPVATHTPVLCGPPSNWITYTVQSGDTLFSLAQDYYTTVYALQIANCLGSSTYIQAGTQIWVPNVATRTPTPTRTPNPGPTDTPAPPSSTPTATKTPTPTATATATSSSPTPTGTSTPIPATPTPTATQTSPPPTATPTPTEIPPTEVPTGTPTATGTSVP